MIIQRKKLFSTSTAESADKKNLAGKATALAGSAYLLGNMRDIKSKVTGRKELYHTTPTSNVDSILSTGLKGIKALDPKNATNTEIDSAGIKDGRKLVYLGKNRIPGLGMKSYYGDLGVKTDTLKVSMPYEEYGKLKFTDKNPEFLGAKDIKDWKKLSLEEFYGKGAAEVMKKEPSLLDKLYYHVFSGKKDSITRIVEGDIDSKHIKGGKGYKKLSMKEVSDYAKKNPKRFAKGVGKAGLGLGTLAIGGTLMAKGVKDFKAEK